MGVKPCVHECVTTCVTAKGFFRYTSARTKAYYKTVVVFLLKGSESLLERALC